MKLRYYQSDAVKAIYQYFMVKSGNPIVAMPTGTGKSIVIGEFVRGIFEHYPTQRVMLLTHVKELIEQNFEKLMVLWPTAPAGIFSSGLNRKETHFPITFAGIDSVHSKAHLFGRIDLVLIDECHLVSPKENTRYHTFIEGLKKVNPNVKVIGFTATHYRLGSGLLTSDTGLFTDLCYDITDLDSFNRLIEEGYLAPLIPKRTSIEYDISDIKIHGGEFVQKDLQIAVDKMELTYSAVKEMVELGHDRKHWLIFASGIEHSAHVAEMLDQFGISNAVVHSKMPAVERDAAIRGFKSGQYQAIINNNILTTGFDFPAIDMIGVLRPTSSTVLWVQMLGRGTRPCEGKENCLVLDFAGNTKRLGPINDPVIPKGKGAKGGNGTAPIKICEVCGTYNHASVRFCVSCQNEFPKQLAIKQTSYTDELIAVKPQIELFKVDRVVYAEHRKQDKPTTLQVTYYSGLRIFKEWVCLEHPHGSFPAKKARDWWRSRSIERTGIPETVAEAIERINQILTPSRIKANVNLKYPEILDYEF